LPTISPAPPKQARRWLVRLAAVYLHQEGLVGRSANPRSGQNIAAIICTDDRQADSGRARPRAFRRARRGVSVAARAPGSCSLLGRRHPFDKRRSNKCIRRGPHVRAHPLTPSYGVIPARAAPRSSRQLFASRPANHVRWLASKGGRAPKPRGERQIQQSWTGFREDYLSDHGGAGRFDRYNAHIKEIAPFLRTREKAPDDLKRRSWRQPSCADCRAKSFSPLLNPQPPELDKTSHPGARLITGVKADGINILGLESPKDSTKVVQLCRNSRWFCPAPAPIGRRLRGGGTEKEQQGRVPRAR
jgi:hypothetical protein